MEKEINNLIMVWSTVAMSSCYCYGTTKLVPKGTIRFFMFLPIICLFFILPLYLKPITFCIPTALFVTWLTSFKLLLLVFDKGPLSSPSLSLTHFVIISCLPIKLLKPMSPTKENGSHNKENDQIGGALKIDLGYLIHYAMKGLVFIFLTILGYFKHNLPQKLVEFLICMYIYLALEMSLVASAVVAQVIFGIEVDQPFGHPYLATSFQDFWGCRWNRVVASSLKATVFYPIYNNVSRVLGRKRAAILALVATFVVSDLMHEILFYYLGRRRLGGGIPIFFVFQGIFVAIETTLKRKLKWKRGLPQKVIGPLIYGFMVASFMWLALPDLMEQKIDDRALEEYAAMAAFVKDLGPSWAQMGRPVWIQFLSKPTSITM